MRAIVQNADGVAVFDGTQISVAAIQEYLRRGTWDRDLLRSYPALNADDLATAAKWTPEPKLAIEPEAKPVEPEAKPVESEAKPGDSIQKGGT